MKKTLLLALTCALVFGVLALSGCRRVRIEEVEGAVGNKTETVEIGNANRAEVELLMGAGELDVRSDAPSGTVLTADFDYRPSKWEPEFKSETTGDNVSVRVAQPDARGFSLGDRMMNRWDVAIGAGIPTDLSLKLGAGDASLALGGTSVEKLDIEMGAGECTVDLSGEWSDDLVAEIKAGVGELTLIVPKGVGVRVDTLEEGIGDTKVEGLTRDGDVWVNSAYDDSAVTLEVRIRQGVGEINIRTAD